MFATSRVMIKTDLLLICRLLGNVELHALTIKENLLLKHNTSNTQKRRQAPQTFKDPQFLFFHRSV